MIRLFEWIFLYVPGQFLFFLLFCASTLSPHDFALPCLVLAMLLCHSLIFRCQRLTFVTRSCLCTWLLLRSFQDMGLVESYRNVMENAADPRVADWSLMGSPLPILGIIFLYLLFVLRLGPLYMKNRKPYNLYNVMICYNMSVVIASAAVFYGLLTSGFTTSLSLGCEMHNASYDPESYRMAKWVWWVMQLKIYEFGDTIIFILRKKYRQVSFLHIYHHASTVFMSWSACKFVPGGMWTFPIMVNCIMHVIMYIYYLLACFGSEMQKNIAPWKRYITTLQIIQFFIMITHFSQAFLPSCEPNRKPLACLYMSEMLLMLYMFSVYYKNSYIRKKAE